MLYDFIEIKRSLRQSPQKQKYQLLPGHGKREEVGVTAEGYGYCCWGDKNIAKLDLADRCTILNIKKHCIVVSIGECVVCELYFSKAI